MYYTQASLFKLFMFGNLWYLPEFYFIILLNNFGPMIGPLVIAYNVLSTDIFTDSNLLIVNDYTFISNSIFKFLLIIS